MAWIILPLLIPPVVPLDRGMQPPLGRSSAAISQLRDSSAKQLAGTHPSQSLEESQTQLDEMQAETITGICLELLNILGYCRVLPGPSCLLCSGY